MNSLDAAFHGMWTVAFLRRFGSFVMEKMSNKGEEPGMVLGGWLEDFLENDSATFLYDEKLGDSILLWKLSMCCSFWSRLFSVITWLLLSVEVQFCSFQRGVLNNFFPAFCFTVFEVVSRTILYHFKRLIGSVPIGEGPEDVAQWSGWTLLSTFVVTLFLCFLPCICLSVLMFSFLF